MLRARGTDTPFSEYLDESWQTSTFRLAVIAIMAASLAAVPSLIRMGIIGDWPPYVLPAALAAGVWGVVTTSLLGRPSWRDRRGAAFRAGEVILLLCAARLLAWLFYEELPDASALTRWLLHPGSFFTGEFWFASLAILPVWAFAVGVTADFLDLAIRPDEVAARLSQTWGDSRSQWRVAVPLARTEVLQRFTTRWISFGVMLVVSAALTRVSIGASPSGYLRVGLRGLGMRPEAIAGLVCYFLSGLLLMSQCRLAVLRGRWFNEDVVIREPVLRRWHANSLAFVGVIALLALLLPLGTTGWLAQLVEWLIALVARLVYGVVMLLGLLFALLTELLRHLFGDAAPSPAQTAPEPPAPSVPSQADMIARLPPWLGGALLWLVVAGVTAFLLLNLVRSTGLMDGPLGARWQRLRFWWRARRQRFAARVSGRLARVAKRLRRARPRATAGRGKEKTLPDGSASPRHRVRRYYLDALQEAADLGVARPKHSTPLEYAEDLTTVWPETEVDVKDLTSAFLDSRYSQHEIDDRQASLAQVVWRRLVTGLRRPRSRDEATQR